MGIFDLFKRLSKKQQPTSTNSENHAVSLSNHEVSSQSDNYAKSVKPSSFAIPEPGVVSYTILRDKDICVSELKKAYIAFDVETTGLDRFSDRIVEVSAVRFENGIVVDSYSSLVNPGIGISASASAVNHITNEMIARAPSEEHVYAELVKYLGDALQGKTALCAHNASFDMDFLKRALSRMGYDATINCIDTLSISRKCIHNTQNHKQTTIAANLGIACDNAHRASADAEVCGKILFHLLAMLETSMTSPQIPTQEYEVILPSDKELAVCAVIQSIIAQNGEDISLLRFHKNKSNYVHTSWLYTFNQFKFARKGCYIVVPQKYAKKTNLETEECSLHEGGSANLRLYLTSTDDLFSLTEYILWAYKDCKKSYEYYISGGNYAKREALQIIQRRKAIDNSEIAALLESAKQVELISRKPNCASVQVEEITRASVIVNPVHTRVSLSKILNSNDWHKGYEEGSPYYYRGDDARKAGDLQEAIRLFDLARYHGYNAPAPYDSYAMAYHQSKDYANEIVICEEGIKRGTKEQTALLRTRRDKAIRYLYKEQEKQRQDAEKKRLAAEKQDQKEMPAQSKPVSTPKGREILQLTDDNTLIKEYPTIAAAVRETGVNSKSIRDAANGVQKHAGGYRWKYKE